MKKKIILATILLLLTLIGWQTEFFGNVWCVLTCRGYRLPNESSLFTFRVKEWNNGSGEWWTYGEDSRYYYVLIDVDSPPYYVKMRKGKEPQGFDPLNSETWGALDYGID